MISSFPDLANDALTLRTWSAVDIDVLVRACNDPELRERLGVPVPYSSDDAREYVALCASGWAVGDQFTFAVADRESGLAVGSVRVGPAPSGATAGYWIAPWARARGVASGALRMVTRWAIGNGLSPIRLYIAPDNIASRSVALKAQYRLDETAEILDPEGRPGDCIYIAIGSPELNKE